MSNQNPNSTSSTDIIFCFIGGIVATILLYVYLLKPIVHPLFFYWKWLLTLPCHFIGKILPEFSTTLQSIFLKFRPESLSRFDDMFLVFDIRFSDKLLSYAQGSGSYSFDEMMQLVSYFSPFSLIIVVPLTLLYISKIKDIRTFQVLYNRETLLQENQKIFSSIVPIVYRDISKEYLNIGPWSMPEPPLFFCILHKLLIVEPNNLQQNTELTADKVEYFTLENVYQGLSNDFNSPAVRNANLVPDPKSPYIRKDNVFREDIAAGIFMRQLGVKFINGHFIGALKRKSLDECGNCWRVVFAGMLYRFGANSSDKKKKAFPILDKFCWSFRGKDPITAKAFSWCTEQLADELFDGYDKNHRFCTDVLPFVTFEYSFMMHLASFAKKNGKLSPSDFLWLRPIDKLLYLSIDQVGARVGHVEALGPWSHYNGELVNGFGLHLPYISNAVEGLYLTLASEGWVPSKNINYNQRKMLDTWIAENSIWNEAKEEISLAEEYDRLLFHGKGIAGWQYVWNIVRPLPDMLQSNPLYSFTDEDFTFYKDNLLSFLESENKNEFYCAITQTPILDFNAYPFYDITINKDNSGSYKITKILPYRQDVETAVLEWASKDDELENLKNFILMHNISKESVDEIFDIYIRMREVFNKVENWAYDADSNPYADLLKIQGSRKKEL